MTTWKSCSECPCFYAPDSDCYRIPDTVLHVEDPSTVPAYCPQESKDRFPGMRYGKFPYVKERCAGCRHDRDNPALVPPSCQNYVVRPLTETCGDCPYHTTVAGSMHASDGYANGWPPIVSRRFADIIVHGINDGDLSYWDIDSCMHRISIGYNRECRHFVVRRDRKGVFTVRVAQTRIARGAAIDIVELEVDHAEIVEDYGYLFLFRGDSRYYNQGCLAIRISDAEVEEQCEMEDEPVEEVCAVQTSPMELAKASTLEEWFS